MMTMMMVKRTNDVPACVHVPKIIRDVRRQS